jgi:outer membrane protein assembly factor BamA
MYFTRTGTDRRTPAVIVFLLFSLFATAPSANESQRRDQAETPRKITIAGIPVASYNRAVGFFFGAMGSLYYKVSESDTISPSSSTLLWGGVTTNSSYALGGMQNLYLREDRWRLSFVGAHGTFVYQFFQDIPASGQYNESGQWIDYSSKGEFVRLDVKRLTVTNVYVGAVVLGNWTTTEFDIIDPGTGTNLTSQATLISLGYTVSYDGRDEISFPTRGFLVNFENRFVREALGASNNYDKFKISANYFWDIRKDRKSILVTRLFADIASGDVPFQAQNTVGRDDLRGYSEGKYRGNQVYAIQAELRQNVYGRIGMVGFLGAGSAVDKVSDIPDSEFLPSIGAGIRYLAIPEEKVRIGIDIGVGRDDWSLAFRIGETFGR